MATDLAARIREQLELLATDQDMWVRVGPWADDVRGLYNAVAAVLDWHKPGYPNGQIEYEERTEDVYNLAGEHRGHATVQGAPVTPYWCESCEVMSPCPQLLALAQALGIEQETPDG